MKLVIVFLFMLLLVWNAGQLADTGQLFAMKLLPISGPAGNAPIGFAISTSCP